MLLTLFLAIVTCASITIMMFSAVAFIQDKKMFSTAPQEFREVIKPRDKELFYGARATGWILTIYKIYDMICFDYFLLMKFHFFQFYFPEIEGVSQNRKYGFNIKSQLIKLLIIFPLVSGLAAWICTLF